MTTTVDAVRKSPLATELTPPELEVLARVMTIRELKDGESGYGLSFLHFPCSPVVQSGVSL